MPAKNPGLDMARSYHTGKNPRILILGSTGRIGQAVIAALEQTPDSHQAVHASRNRDQVSAWRGEGKDSVHLDLDDPRTFPEALKGVDRLFLATGYTIHMVHQSKTIVDAAADAGVEFIVHLGIFGNGRMTDPHFAWHEMANYAASMIEWARQTYDGRMEIVERGHEVAGHGQTWATQYSMSREEEKTSYQASVNSTRAPGLPARTRSPAGCWKARTPFTRSDDRT